MGKLKKNEHLIGYAFATYPEKIPFASSLPSKDEDLDEEMLKMFFSTMYERQMLFHRRHITKTDFPWTEDPILRDYKFTNVYRELDRSSQWLIRNILLDHSLSVEDLLFRLVIYRFYNQPNTFLHHKNPLVLPHYEDFDSKKNWMNTREYRSKVDNPWQTAYMMNVTFLKLPEDWDRETLGYFKDYAYCVYVFDKIHKIIPKVVELINNKGTAKEYTKLMETCPAVSGFMSHEFFLDICYANQYWKRPLNDWTTDSYTNVGPGASLGLRLIFPSTPPNEQTECITILRDLAEEYFEDVLEVEFPYLYWDAKKRKYVEKNKCNITLHQIEMWLCEFSKYWKVSIKTGKQRTKYLPSQKSSGDKSFYLY